MRKSVFRVVLVLANDDIANSFLVMPADGLGHSWHRSWNKHSYIERHGLIRNIHFVVLYEQLDFGSHYIRILIDWDLIHRRIVFFLLLLFWFLFLFRRHAELDRYINMYVSFIFTLFKNQFAPNFPWELKQLYLKLTGAFCACGLNPPYPGTWTKKFYAVCNFKFPLSISFLFSIFYWYYLNDNSEGLNPW